MARDPALIFLFTIPPIHFAYFNPLFLVPNPSSSTSTLLSFSYRAPSFLIIRSLHPHIKTHNTMLSKIFTITAVFGFAFVAQGEFPCFSFTAGFTVSHFCTERNAAQLSLLSVRGPTPLKLVTTVTRSHERTMSPRKFFNLSSHNSAKVFPLFSFLKKPSFQLATVNKGKINDQCTDLQPGATLCLGNTGEDCTETYVVKLGDTCDGVSGASGLNNTILYHNNPQIDQGCTNIYVGEVSVGAIIATLS